MAADLKVKRRFTRNSKPVPVRGLSQWIALVLLGSLLTAWYWPTLTKLHNRWANSGVEYGYAVVAMALVAAVFEVRRHGVPGLTKNWVPGAGLLGLCILGVTLSRAAGVTVGTDIALPVVLFAGLLVAFGWRYSLHLVPVLLFLYFAIPFWQVFDFLPVSGPELNESLRLLTIVVVSAWVKLSGIIAALEGDLIHLPAGTLHIAEGCSGRAYFLVAAELSVFYSLIFMERWSNRLKFICAILLSALIANWIRVYALVLIGYWSRMQSPLVEEHEAFGWVVFLLVLIPMILLGRYYEAKEADSDAVIPEPPEQTSTPHFGGSWVAAAMLLTAIWLTSRIDAVYAVEGKLAAPSNLSVSGWSNESPWADASRPQFEGAVYELARWYRRDATRVGLYLAGYPVQRQGSEAIYYANRPAGAGAITEITDYGDLRLVGPGRFMYRELVVTEGDRTRLVWHLVQVAGQPSRSPVHAKWLQVLGAVKGRSDAQVIVLTAYCQVDCDSVRAQLTAFASQTTARLIQVASPPAVTGQDSADTAR